MRSSTLEATSAETRAQTLSAVGDPIRLQILDMLTLGQRCACEIQEQVGVAPNLSSYHLRVRRRVLKTRQLATFIAIVGTGILIVGFLFNMVL